MPLTAAVDSLQISFDAFQDEINVVKKALRDDLENSQDENSKQLFDVFQRMDALKAIFSELRNESAAVVGEKEVISHTFLITEF